MEKGPHSNTGKIAGLDHKQDSSSTPTPLCLQSGKRVCLSLGKFTLSNDAYTDRRRCQEGRMSAWTFSG